MADKVEDPGKAIRAKSMEEFAKRMKGKPTPTQDELDRINMGEHVKLEPDGSDEENPTKEVTAGSGGSYQTRQATPARSAPKAE